MQNAAGHRQGRQGRAGRHPSAAARRDGAAGAGRPHRDRYRRCRGHRLGHQFPARSSRAATSAGCRRSTPAMTSAPAASRSIASAVPASPASTWRPPPIMSGSEDLVIAGGTEMMSMEGRRGEGPVDDGRRQSSPARQAPAVASGRLRRRRRDAGRHYAAGRRQARLREPAEGRQRPSRPAISTRAWFRSIARMAALRSTGRSIRGRRPRSKGWPA